MPHSCLPPAEHRLVSGRRLALVPTTGLALRCRHRRRAAAGPCAAAQRQDQVLRSVSENGECSLLCVTGTNLVAEACRRHKTAPTASAALGRALLGALLMCSFKGENDSLHLTFKGDGPLRGIQAIATARGEVKGRVGEPGADPPLRGGKLDVGRAVGKGVLAVVRSSGQEGSQPYTGLTEIRSGEVAEDLAAYLADSEQTNSALALGVSIDREAGVRAAGGYLLQVLPFASEATLRQLEQNIAANPSVTDMLHSGLDAAGVTERLLQGLGASPGTFSLEPRQGRAAYFSLYGPCDEEALRGRMARAVALLGPGGVEDLVLDQGKIEVRCEFCCETFRLDPDAVRAQARGDPARAA